MKNLIFIILILSGNLFAQTVPITKPYAFQKYITVVDSVVSRFGVYPAITYFPSIYTTRPGTIINYKDSGLYRLTGVSWLKLETDTSSLSYRIDLKLNITDTSKLHNQIVGKINKADSTGYLSGNYVTRKALRDTINYALTGKLTNKGNYDASVNQWPTGTINNGDWYTVSVKGYINPDSLRVGDIITAKIDNPGQTNSNWNIITHTSNVAVPQPQIAGSARIGYLPYNGLTQLAGAMDGGTSDPTHTTRLNYDGQLYAYLFNGLLSAKSSTSTSAIKGLNSNAGGASIEAYNGFTNFWSNMANSLGGSGTYNRIGLKMTNTSAYSGTITVNTDYISIIDNPTIGTGTSAIGKVLSATIGTTERISLNPRVTDGASAVAYMFDTHITLSTTGAKHTVFRNQGTDLSFLDKDGYWFANKFYKGLTAVADSQLTTKGYVDSKVGGVTLIQVRDIAKWKDSTQIHIGSNALQNITTGYENIAIGYNAGNALTNQYANTVIGNYALWKGTGIGNTVVGYGSMGNLTNGSTNNVSIGQNAMSYANGNYNVSVGDMAGYVCGSNNISIGSYAGYFNAGNNRLFINSIERQNLGEDTTKSLIYGYQNTVVSKQRLYFNCPGITVLQLSGSLTDGIPTNAEINSIIGKTATQAGAGYQVTIKDTDGTGLLYKVESDGANWFYIVMTKAL